MEEISQQLIHSLIQSRHGAAQAALIRRLGAIDPAEDAMQDAVVKALEYWPEHGVPDNIVAWLVTTGMNSFRDAYRRDVRAGELLRENFVEQESLELDATALDDDVLSLIFMCCHPAIAVENQLALTLKTVMGFSVQEIAHGFLLQEATLEQRLTRSKRKIARAGINFEQPREKHLNERLSPVQHVLYLIFNEGYYGSSGELLNQALCRQAIALCRSLCRGFPETENFGLLALMLFQDSRAPARLDAAGDLVTLDKQDRSVWRQSQIQEADVLLQKALRKKQSGFYQLQAAIAGLHSLSKSSEDTDWLQIVGLYRLLQRLQANPVIALNYGVAMFFAGMHSEARKLIIELEAELSHYSPYWAARAKLAATIDDNAEAAVALRNAMALSGSAAEMKHYQVQLQRHEENAAENSLPVH